MTVKEQKVVDTDEGKISILAKLDDFSNDTLYRLYGVAAGYVELPVEIDEFIESSEFLNYEGDKVWPWVRKALREIFPNPFFSPYSELLVTGAIGTGKSTLGAIGCLYDLYKLLCMRNPHSKFGLLPHTKIEFVVVNATLDLSKETTWDVICSMLVKSPYFKDKMEEAESITGNNAMFPNRTMFNVGSLLRHVLGQAVYSALLDELNFHVIQKTQAYDTYTGIKRRMHSRFIRGRGLLPGHIWLLSSVKDESSFLDAMVKETTKEANSATRIFSLSLWEAHRGVPEKDIYCGETFKVFAGSESKDPFIIDESHDLKGADPEKIISVPIEFKEEFVKDIQNSLRDIAGIPISQFWKLFSSVETLRESLSGSNIFNKEVVAVSDSDVTNEIRDCMNWREYIKGRDKPHKIRYVHLDMALSGDKLGLAIGYISDYIIRSVRKLDGNPLEVIKWRWPRITIEGVIALQALPGKEIPLWKVREFLKELFNNGVSLAVTADLKAMSADTLQLLSSIGIDTSYLSVDRDKAPYASLKLAVNEGRWVGPKHSLLEKELRELQDTGKMYDHPPKGSKDCADACSGVTYRIITEVSGREEQVENMKELVDHKPTRRLGAGNVIEQLRKMERATANLQRRFRQ